MKNVGHLTYTAQLRDLGAYAREEVDLHPFTRGPTTFSKPLRVEINASRIVLDSTRLGLDECGSSAW